MKQSVLFILAYLVVSFSCQAQGKVEVADPTTISIVRYATDLRLFDAEPAELLVNILFVFNGKPSRSRIELEVPKAKELEFRQIFVQVSSADKLILRQKIRKPDAGKLSELDPYALALKYGDFNKPLTVEWEIRVSLDSLSGSYKWPSIVTDNFERIDHLSFRVAYDKELPADLQTNLTADPQKDAVNGNFYYLWELNDLDSSGVDLYGQHSREPNVILNFR